MQQEVREAFKVLNKYNFFIHGYFIYGNIGETEEEMVYISRFAKELKLDSISFQKLRVDKFSPLKQVIENTLGYYYTATHGSVYSDRYSIKDLKRIRSRIKFKFYTLGQIARIIRKIYKIEFLTKSELMFIIMRLPRLLVRVLKKE